MAALLGIPARLAGKILPAAIGEAAGVAGDVVQEVTSNFEEATAASTPTPSLAATSSVAPVVTTAATPSVITVTQAPAAKTEPVTVTLAPPSSTLAVHSVEDLTTTHATHAIKGAMYTGHRNITNKAAIASNETSADVEQAPEQPEPSRNHKPLVERAPKIRVLHSRMLWPTLMAVNQARNLVPQSHVLPASSSLIPTITPTAVQTSHGGSIGKRFDTLGVMSKTVIPTSMANAIDAMAAPATYTTCVPGQACYGINGILTTSASVPSEVQVEDLPLTEASVNITAGLATGPSPYGMPLTPTLANTGILVRRQINGGAPYPMATAGTGLNGTLLYASSGVVSEGKAFGYLTAAVDANPLVPRAVSSISSTATAAPHRQLEVLNSTPKPLEKAESPDLDPRVVTNAIPTPTAAGATTLHPIATSSRAGPSPLERSIITKPTSLSHDIEARDEFVKTAHSSPAAAARALSGDFQEMAAIPTQGAKPALGSPEDGAGGASSSLSTEAGGHGSDAPSQNEKQASANKAGSGINDGCSDLSQVSMDPNEQLSPGFHFGTLPRELAASVNGDRKTAANSRPPPSDSQNTKGSDGSAKSLPSKDKQSLGSSNEKSGSGPQGSKVNPRRRKRRVTGSSSTASEKPNTKAGTWSDVPPQTQGHLAACPISQLRLGPGVAAQVGASASKASEGRANLLPSTASPSTKSAPSLSKRISERSSLEDEPTPRASEADLHGSHKRLRRRSPVEGNDKLSSGSFNPDQDQWGGLESYSSSVAMNSVPSATEVYTAGATPAANRQPASGNQPSRLPNRFREALSRLRPGRRRPTQAESQSGSQSQSQPQGYNQRAGQPANPPRGQNQRAGQPANQPQQQRPQARPANQPLAQGSQAQPANLPQPERPQNQNSDTRSNPPSDPGRNTGESLAPPGEVQYTESLPPSYHSNDDTPPPYPDSQRNENGNSNSESHSGSSYQLGQNLQGPSSSERNLWDSIRAPTPNAPHGGRAGLGSGGAGGTASSQGGNSGQGQQYQRPSGPSPPSQPGPDSKGPQSKRLRRRKLVEEDVQSFSGPSSLECPQCHNPGGPNPAYTRPHAPANSNDRSGPHSPGQYAQRPLGVFPGPNTGGRGRRYKRRDLKESFQRRSIMDHRFDQPAVEDHAYQSAAGNVGSLASQARSRFSSRSPGQSKSRPVVLGKSKSCKKGKKDKKAGKKSRKGQTQAQDEGSKPVSAEASKPQDECEDDQGRGEPATDPKPEDAALGDIPAKDIAQGEAFPAQEQSSGTGRRPTPPYPPPGKKPEDFGLDRWDDLTPEEGRRLMKQEAKRQKYPDDSEETFDPPEKPPSIASTEPGTRSWTGRRLSGSGADLQAKPESMSDSIPSDVSEGKNNPHQQGPAVDRAGQGPSRGE